LLPLKPEAAHAYDDHSELEFRIRYI